MVAFGFAFEELRLHRLEIAIVPRNDNSRRVMDEAGGAGGGHGARASSRSTGTWEDHVRYGFTVEEWWQRRAELWDRFVAEPPPGS